MQTSAVADLRGADLRWCRMVRTILHGTKLDGARVFGLSAWSVKTDALTSQRALVITEEGAALTVDRLDIAQLLTASYIDTNHPRKELS